MDKCRKHPAGPLMAGRATHPPDSSAPVTDLLHHTAALQRQQQQQTKREEAQRAAPPPHAAHTIRRISAQSCMGCRIPTQHRHAASEASMTAHTFTPLKQGWPWLAHGHSSLPTHTHTRIEGMRHKARHKSTQGAAQHKSIIDMTVGHTLQHVHKTPAHIHAFPPPKLHKHPQLLVKLT